jgi:hypothetical protein
MKEISGGGGNAITKSCRGRNSNRPQQFTMKLAKSAARRHLAVLPKRVEETRKMRMPRHVSRAGNSFSG